MRKVKESIMVIRYLCLSTLNRQVTSVFTSLHWCSHRIRKAYLLCRQLCWFWPQTSCNTGIQRSPTENKKRMENYHVNITNNQKKVHYLGFHQIYSCGSNMIHQSIKQTTEWFDRTLKLLLKFMYDVKLTNMMHSNELALRALISHDLVLLIGWSWKGITQNKMAFLKYIKGKDLQTWNTLIQIKFLSEPLAQCYFCKRFGLPF